VGEDPFHLKFAIKVTHLCKKRRLRQISPYIVSTVRASKNVNYHQLKVDHGLSNEPHRSAYVTPIGYSMGGSKNEFTVFVSQLMWTKVCYKVSLCESFQLLNCSLIIPLSNGPQKLAVYITFQSNI